MRKLVSFFHVSLDGYIAGLNGEMDWIKVDEEIFEHVGDRVKGSDTALYGRVTWQMMEGYWPTAGDEPNASKHDIEHSAWYKKAKKVVLSKSMQNEQLPNTTFIGEDVEDRIKTLKQADGTEILIFGSPSATHSLLQYDLIDEFWLFVNPILLSKGIPLFKNVTEKTPLTLVSSKTFTNGVVCMHYKKA
ncbi:dihydrofolate reductase family protein [Chitinophaga pinensis]|uniref:Bifunctional deaminase-reductase domain protein n=1 Tax=Chitinophaga pinensis (strain ATCC 43595 / DSM 2588 / LMG 13176 / NBRC 15968 / NCIMB 11800 / UQM 2034) TaxID=485918 RepID=A0A979G6X9_CHIPD|nr:dihydrofolate reductase family protein [Chitinophaga pinensis]ACU61748.1 bifunctional deaminase-reductase domain protein [Chitinophaga pinensis DSM 2588]